MLILECSQGCHVVKIWPGDIDLWPWKSIGFQTLLRTMYVPSLIKIHWRMLILECSQGCYAGKIWPGDLDLWPWKSIRFKILLRTKYVPSLVKIHWRMLILECSQGCYGRTDGSVTISLRNFVGKGIITLWLCSVRNHYSPKARREQIWRVRLCKNSTNRRPTIVRRVVIILHSPLSTNLTK
jgi:hypothetical protein